MDVISLFSGAGGLDLGLEAAGFKTRLCVEIDEDARATLKLNRPGWPLSQPGDIHELNPVQVLAQAGLKPRQVTLLAGGPPCAPFSKSGYWSRGDSARLKDPRAKTLTAYLRVVETALPVVLLLENVKGLAFDGKDEGLQLLRQEIAAINARQRTNYVPQIVHMNAADYGVPQIRERIFVVAHIDGAPFVTPPPTHKNSEASAQERLLPYLTAWDAIGDLDFEVCPEELQPTGKWAALLPTVPEGKNYLWHTPRSGGMPLFGWRTRYWSFLLKLAKNQPSWTIQAEPGPATGPFHWKNRLLSVAELRRLQTFPDDYQIEGDRRSVQRQIGNAVPCAIGELLGLEIRRQFLRTRVRRELKLIPARRPRCPRPHRLRSVPTRYACLKRKHRDHPGTGRGPGARRRQAAQ